MARAFGSYPECRWFESNCRYQFWPGGQEVKTPPFHGGNTSSILVRVTKQNKSELFRESNLVRICFLLLIFIPRQSMCTPYITTRKVKYPYFVNQNKIVCRGANGYRFLLYIPFSGSFQKNELVVIMKNPSSASITTCDQTISKVCNTAHYNGYSGVIILNLFPYRATNATQVQQFYANKYYQSIMNRNLRIIQKTCFDKDVVFALGKDSIKGRRQYPTHYDNAISNITSTVISRTYYAVRCTCNNQICSSPQHPPIRYPLHGLAWSNQSTLYPY